MRFSNLFPARRSACIVLCCLASTASSYFVITEPPYAREWRNGQANLVTWVKGVMDGIDNFDVEISRLSEDGLTFVARNVPSVPNVLNIELQDVPPGDDYFLVFINSTHGIMYTTSSRFTILPSSSAANSSSPSADSSAATVTVSGSPNPTMNFATTFPASSDASPRWRLVSAQAWGLGTAALGCVLGAVWTLS